MQNVYRYSLDGSVPPAQRNQLVTSFNAGYGGDVFLLSCKAGGVGLNLVGRAVTPGVTRLVTWNILHTGCHQLVFCLQNDVKSVNRRITCLSEKCPPSSWARTAWCCSTRTGTRPTTCRRWRACGATARSGRWLSTAWSPRRGPCQVECSCDP
jgi:hypothetical protein